MSKQLLLSLSLNMSHLSAELFSILADLDFGFKAVI